MKLIANSESFVVLPASLKSIANLSSFVILLVHRGFTGLLKKNFKFNAFVTPAISVVCVVKNRLEKFLFEVKSKNRIENN